MRLSKIVFLFQILLIDAPPPQVVDARSHQRFSGATNEPRPGLPSGHMIGSINLPYTSFFNRDTKTLACKTVIHEGNISFLEDYNFFANFMILDEIYLP